MAFNYLTQIYAQPAETFAQKAKINYSGYYYYGGGGRGAAAPAPAPAAAPTAPAAVTASTVSDLQVLIASIPIAQDGQVISAEYHNALRAALIAMANRLGLGVISEEIVITNTPLFEKVEGQGEWKIEAGLAKKATADTGALRGWMALDLPDGARIKKMQVFAANDAAGTMRVKLRRQSVANSTASDDLVSIDITANDATIAREGDVTLPSSTVTGSAIEEARIVDNRKFKYLLVAELDGGVAGKDARITAVQVILGK